MSKWDELKRLADTAISLREHGRTSEGEPEWDEADDAFWNAITPELIAELIAENERMHAELSERRYAMQEAGEEARQGLILLNNVLGGSNG